MSISRVNPGNWISGDVLTPLQLTTIDANLATKATDKRGDTITGAITSSGASSHTFASGSALGIDAGATLALAGTTTLGATGEFRPIVGTGTRASGSTTTYQAGSTLDLRNAATVTGTLLITGASSLLKTASGGRIQLADNDEIELAAGHTGMARVITFRLTGSEGVGDALGNTTWSGGVGNAQSYLARGIRINTQGTQLIVTARLECAHHAAVLASVRVLFTPVSTASGRTPATVPANPPKARVYRVQSSVGYAPPSTLESCTVSAAYYVYAADAGTYGDGNVHELTVPTWAWSTIDRQSTQYVIDIVDESGANSINGNEYHAIRFVYSTIADMRFS